MGGSNVRGKTKASGDDIVSLDTAVETAITAMTRLLNGDAAVRGSVTDLIRLLQLRKEMEAERPRKVTVRWIDECEKSTGE